MNNEVLFSRLKFRARDLTRRLILHDSHTGPDVENAVDYLRNKGRELGLLDVGYHGIIDREGVLTQTREWTVRGSHAPGHNFDSIGLCLIGGAKMDGWLEGGAFTFSQKRTLFETYSLLCRTWPYLELVGHTEIQKFTKRECSCPAIDMDELRKDYGMYIAYGIIP